MSLLVEFSISLFIINNNSGTQFLVSAMLDNFLILFLQQSVRGGPLTTVIGEQQQ